MNESGYKLLTIITAALTMFSLGAALYFFNGGESASGWICMYPTAVGIIALLYAIARKKTILTADSAKIEEIKEIEAIEDIKEVETTEAVKEDEVPKEVEVVDETG
jgi:hypothetical protein